MKTRLCIAVVAMTPFVALQAQPSPTGGGPGATTNGLAWQATARDGLSTTWEATEQMTNAVTGVVAATPHRYVEVASGLNYLDPTTGQYQPSQDLIELASDGGAAAVHGPAKLYVHPNLNTAGAITIVTASNRVFQTKPLGVFWYNAQSGQAILVAPVQDCVGELVPPNQVVFKSAFGPLADLRLVYTKSGIESDLVLLQAPTLPAGWNPQTTRLELWHDWTGSPAPRLTPRLLYAETNATLRSQMSEPDLTDQILDFGDLWFPTGAAYAADGSAGATTTVARQVRVPNLARDSALVPVAKTWLRTPNLQILIEGVRWPDVQPKLQGLPPATRPAPPVLAQNRSACLSQLPAPPSTSQTAAVIELAHGDYRPSGVVLDYITVPSSWWGYDYSFDSGTTYYVTNTTYFGGGTVTFQPGCIIKFKPSTYLLMYGAIVCNGSSSAPSILTSQDDDVYGYVFTWSTHCPSYAAAPAVWDYNIPNNVSLTGMWIRWAQTGIEFDGSGDPYCNGYPDCCGQTNTVADCSLEFCRTGILVNRCGANLAASTTCGVATPTNSEWTCQWCQPFFGSLTDVGSGNDPYSGFSYVWEYQYFGHDHVNPSDDADGDGFSNLQEYNLGGNPTVNVNGFTGYPAGFHFDTATPLGLATSAGQPISFTLAGSSPCNTPLGFQYGGQLPLPQHGSLSGTLPTLTYTPTANYVGPDSFQFTAGDSWPATVTIDVVSGPVLLVTGNYCSGGTSCTGGYNQIQTFSLSDGTPLNTFLPQGGANQSVNGRGLAIQGGQIYYTEVPQSGNGGSDGIHVCNYGTDGSGGTTDSRPPLPNPRPGAGIQALSFYGGYLYALTGYPNLSPVVFKIDPSSGAVQGNPIPITGNAADDCDGFVVLPSGNFLMNDRDGAPPYPATIYREYYGPSGNGTPGAEVPGGLMIDLSACGAQWARGVALAPDAQSLYFYAGNHYHPVERSGVL